MTDIWIAGLGVRGVNQVTREVEHALRASREVLYLDVGVATRPYLESLCPRVTVAFRAELLRKIGRASTLTSTWRSASCRRRWKIRR